MLHDDVRILLVDDSEDHYLITSMVLSEIPGLSWTLKWYRTYQDGLTQVMQPLYDVALVDNQLGEQRTGIDLVREAVDAGCTTPVILLTSSQERAVDVAAMQAGAADYLIKGELSAQLLERSIRYARERRRAMDALAEERALLARRVAERTAELSAANAELARAAHLKDAFLASMSHELRTPLNGILGLSESLAEGIYGDLTAKQHEALKTISASGMHLLELINDILDLAKIGAGKMELSFAPVEVVLVAQTSLCLISQMAQQKKLHVVSSFDSSVGMIQADARSLTQILVNLLSNAVKFTPSGGSIGLDIVGEAAERVVHCTVWDTGIGIGDDDQARIFQPFVQLDGRLSRQYAGTGLGLALVAQLVDLHRGSIAVTSAIGHGSRFTITLPWNEISEARDTRMDEATGKDQDAGSPDSQARQARILVVDDNPTNLAMVVEYLTAKGFEVLIAREGAAAVAQTRESHPDAIVMDIQMPGMDGLEAIRCIRADPMVARVPIIALTALAMPTDRKDCLAAGADEYLSKPVKLRTLLEMLETRLGHAASARIGHEPPDLSEPRGSSPTQP
jgi:signal transduction histidine kinase